MDKPRIPHSNRRIGSEYFQSEFDKDWKRIGLFHNFIMAVVIIGIVFTFTMAGVGMFQQMSCKNKRYVRGTECYDNGDRTVCKEAMIYDGCND